MVTMAESAVNWRNMHTHMDHTHLLTHSNTVTTRWCEAPAQLLHFSACWFFSCFHNPSELWHGIQDLYHAYMIILVRAYTHGGWAHRQWVSTTFLTQKNSQIFLVLLTGFEPRSFGSRVQRSTNWATPSPHYIKSFLHYKLERST